MEALYSLPQTTVGHDAHQSEPMVLNGPTAPTLAVGTNVVSAIAFKHEDASMELGVAFTADPAPTSMGLAEVKIAMPSNPLAIKTEGEMGAHPESINTAIAHQTTDPAKPVAAILASQEDIKQTLMITKPSALFSPQPARTPTGDQHAALKCPHTVSPTEDLLASPTRPLTQANPAIASPLPPPSAGKREVNEAAMALTWLSEAFSAAPMSPPPPRRPAAADALLSTDPSQATGLRGRRAASQRCTTVIREALQAEREFGFAPKGIAAAMMEGAPVRAPRKPRAPTAEGVERKAKGYSQNSRVGRCMLAIVKFITRNQPKYENTASGGVPERIIRAEFGNNPDTSKALRFLVGEFRIAKAGAGGRRDPFSYTLAGTDAAQLAEAAAAAAAAAAGGGAAPAAATISPVGVASPDSAAAAVASAQGPVAATPAAAALDNVHFELAAAAALTMPSTGKWPSTAPRQDLPRKPQQPRLSLDMAMPNAQEHLAGASLVLKSGMKRPANVAFTPNNAVNLGLSARRPSLDGAVAATPTNAEAMKSTEGAYMMPSSFALHHKLPIAELQATPAPATGKDRVAQWPSQLPSTQRLTSLTSPPAVQAPSTAIAGMATPSSVFFMPGSAALMTSTPGAQAAYLLQLQAAQMYWQHQWAAQQAAAAAGAPAVPAAAPGVAGTAVLEPATVQQA